MQNLIQFLIKYRFLFLFLFLETVSVSMIVRFNAYPSALYFNSTNAISASMLEGSSSISSYFSLKSENERLVYENKQLRTLIDNHIEQNKSLLLEKGLSSLFQDTLNRYSFIKGKVIKNSTFYSNNFITLNKGAADCIKKDMGIISSGGVVGRVKYVSEHYCIAISVLNKKMTVSGEIKGENILGTIAWSGKNYRYVNFNYVPRHINVTIGDTIVASGFNAIFPQGTAIGIIEESKLEDGEDFHDIRVKLQNDFNSLRHVLFVEDLNSDELKELEEKLNQ